MVDQISKEQLAEFKDAFASFDKEGKDVILTSELDAAMKLLGHYLPQAELMDIINEIDQDGSGYIDFSEFVVLMSYFHKYTDIEEELVEAFRVFDQNGIGWISLAETRQVLTSFKQKLTDTQVEELINEADNGDGQINYEEMVKVLMSL